MCHNCAHIKSLLKEHNIEFEEINALANQDAAIEVAKKSGLRQLPIIEIDDKFFSFEDKEKIKEILKID